MVFRRCSLILLATLAAAMAAEPAQAQIFRDTLKYLALPNEPEFPAYRWQNVYETSVGFNIIRVSNDTYGRVLLPDTQQSQNPDNVWYVLLRSPANAKINASVYWDYPIPKGGYKDGEWRDSCGHSHFAYYAFIDSWFFTGAQWVRLFNAHATEGRVGRRYDWVNGVYQPVSGVGKPDLICNVSSDPSDNPALRGSIWKSGSTTGIKFYYSSTLITNYLVFAMQAATHGWGPCNLFQCFPKVGFWAYRTQ